MPCNAGPVDSLIGWWQLAQLELKSVLPSGWAKAEKLQKSRTTKGANSFRAISRNIGLIDSDTGINLKINFPFRQSVRKTTTQ